MTNVTPEFGEKSGGHANDNKGDESGDLNKGGRFAVAVFAASSPMFDTGFADDAKIVGRTIGEKGYHFIYGGGTYGLMGISSKAALDAGGTITGYMMSCFDEDHHYPQKEFEVLCLTLAERKQKMLLDADAYIALGGGFGTLDELVEAGVEQYMGGYADPPVPQKPIILINRNGIYDPFKAQLEKFIEQGSAKPALMDFFTFVKDGEEAMQVLEKMKNAQAKPCQAIGNVHLDKDAAGPAPK